MKIIRYIRDFYLYTSTHISLCGVLLYAFSAQITGEAFNTYYALFLFSGTMVIYNVHRLIGFAVKGKDIVSPRFNKYRYHQIGLSGAIVICSILGGYAFFQLDDFWDRMWHWMLIAILMSAAYVTPVFPNHKRLRDYDFIKIWVIAAAWTILTLVIPLETSKPSLILIVERILFFVAITIPFDIRDLYIDKHQKVKTIPSTIGVKNSIYFALFLLAANIILVLSQYNVLGIVPVLSYIMTYGITAWLILNANEKRKDIYYTAYLDGTIALTFIILNGFYILQQLAR